MQEQAAKVVHAQQNLVGAHEAGAALLPALNRIVPRRLRSYFLCNSGSEAVDNAVKVARAATGRGAVIAFDVSFARAGRTGGRAGGRAGRSGGGGSLCGRAGGWPVAAARPCKHDTTYPLKP